MVPRWSPEVPKTDNFLRPVPKTDNLLKTNLCVPRSKIGRSGISRPQVSVGFRSQAPDSKPQFCKPHISKKNQKHTKNARRSVNIIKKKTL